jgi:hypothetical protein
LDDYTAFRPKKQAGKKRGKMKTVRGCRTVSIRRKYEENIMRNDQNSGGQ